MKYFGQNWPVLGVVITAIHLLEKWTSEWEACAFLVFLPHSMSTNCKEKVASCGLWVSPTLVHCDFRQFQLTVLVSAWGLIQGQRASSASESLLWASVLNLSQRQPKRHFSWRVTQKGDFLILWRDNQLVTSSYYWVDTSWYLVDSGLVCASAQQVPQWWVVIVIMSVAISQILILSLWKSIWVVTEKYLGLSAFQCTS